MKDASDKKENAMSRLSFWKRIGVVLVFCAVAAIGSPAQTLTTLYSFCTQTGCTDGYVPEAGLVQATDGNFYGTTYAGGANTTGCGGFGCGTVFKITTGGTLTTLYSFDGVDGGNPSAGLVQATDGNFYGTTAQGGVYTSWCNRGSCGTVFKITPSGTLTTLYSFCSQASCTDGANPTSGLIQADDGNLYGTTEYGGIINLGECGGGVFGSCGTVFKITPSGTLTTLYSFCPQASCTDGANPASGVIEAGDGNLYGTTLFGGSLWWLPGTVFKITPSGTLTTLYSGFGVGNPSGLVQATHGNLYGTTNNGGAGGQGTIFTITHVGTMSTLHSFDGTDGAAPEAGLVQAIDGNFYGTTSAGGANGNGGTVFQFTPARTLTTLSLAPYSDPQAGLVQGTDGNLYGTTMWGGAFGNYYGTVFQLSWGMGPFVTARPTSGKVGGKVIILGNNLTGSTSVTFNGTPVTFTVNPTGTAIKTSVPSGATTGKVQVVTPSGTLTSNVNFHVRP
jgi:uncharacterized repeat protein (TIGR03803 family)